MTESNTVKTIHNKQGHTIIRYYEDGRRHRDGEPAEIIMIGNEVIRLRYFVKGKPKLDGLSEIRRRGPLIEHHYYHTNQGLTKTVYHFDTTESRFSKLVKIEHYLNGVLGNFGEPAQIMFNSKGKVEIERYYQSGKLHRMDDDQPAVLYYGYDDNGVQYIRSETYCLDGHIKRWYNGPVAIDYGPGGVVECTYHMIDGKLMPASSKKECATELQQC